MEFSNFDGLLEVAGQQTRPQRLLFVFVKTVLQKDYTEQQRAGFAAGEGGALQPLFCVDRAPTEIAKFESFVAEADEQSPDWDKMLVASIDEPVGADGGSLIDRALEMMVARVQTGGSLRGYLCFRRDGTPLVFE